MGFKLPVLNKPLPYKKVVCRSVPPAGEASSFRSDKADLGIVSNHFRQLSNTGHAQSEFIGDMADEKHARRLTD